MRKIRILAALSIDGFYVPLKLQESYGIAFSEYDSFYKDVNFILKDMDGYQELQKSEENFEGKVILVIGNNRKLISYLLLRNLITDITVCTFPVWLGKGKRLFPVISNQNSKWETKERHFYDSGVTIVRYQKCN